MINQKLKEKLAELPDSPGIYFHKNSNGQIIYIGKAAVLKNRVRQYFQKSKTRDPKTEALISEIADVDWVCVDSEIEALFLEAELIRRYMPSYNILLRDDKALSYIRIDINSDYPTVTTTRRPLDDGAKYFGPYYSTYAVRQALKILRKIFPYATKKVNGQKRANLHYYLGLDPGLEDGKTTLLEYKANLKKLIAVIQGRRKSIIKELERDMKKAAKAHDFEEAAKIRNKLNYLTSLNRQVIFSDKEFLDINKDYSLNELVNLLSLKAFPKRIEGYDISHMQGTDVVASMVVFTNGASDKAAYRKFKTKINQNNDFYNMSETLKRRLSPKNIRNWGLPDLVLIDGGKGQLDAAINSRDQLNLQGIPFIGLAKRDEQIVIDNNRSNVALSSTFLNSIGGYATSSNNFTLINLPKNTNLVKLLQRIRDESHRFAVSYHRQIKTKRQTASSLDQVPGVGPATRKRLLKHFGSMRNISKANIYELEQLVGKHKASAIKQFTA